MSTVRTLDSESTLNFGLELSSTAVTIYGLDASSVRTSAECTDTLTTATAASCPATTAVETNPQSSNPDVTVLRLEQCAPCDTGYTCAGNGAAPAACPAGDFTDIIGATSCKDCPDGTASAGGE